MRRQCLGPPTLPTDVVQYRRVMASNLTSEFSLGSEQGVQCCGIKFTPHWRSKMSKIVGIAVAALLVLPLLANPAFASKNIGTRPTGITMNASSNCETIMVPQWKCPEGKSPGDFACTLILVEQQVCHAA